MSTAMDSANGTAAATVESKPPLALYKAMHAARARITTIAQSGNNTFDGYKYPTLEDYIDGIEAALAEEGLLMRHDVVQEVKLASRENHKKNLEQVREVRIRTTLIHVETGESTFTEFPAEGMDLRDKASLKANTSAKKFAIGNLLNLKTGIDVELDVDGRNAPQREERRRTDSKPPAGKQQTAKGKQQSATPPEKKWPEHWDVPKLCEKISGKKLLREFIDTWNHLTANPKLLNEAKADWLVVLSHFNRTWLAAGEPISEAAAKGDHGPWEAFKVGTTSEELDAFSKSIAAERERMKLPKPGDDEQPAPTSPAQGTDSNDGNNQAV